MNQNYFEPNPSYSGFDQPSQNPIDQSPPQEMSIQYIEDLKQQYLEEMKSMINQIQTEDYRNERIDIHYRRECEIKIDELKANFKGMITPILSIEDLEDFLIMENEDLNTIPEIESYKFIKSSVEDLVPILSDDIELLLHHDPSTPKMSVASILEGFTNEPPLEENDDLFNLESKENEWKKILYDAPIDDLMTEDKVFDPGIHEKKISPTYVTLPFKDRHYLSLTYVI
nr:hypothetical protein [Tanacetum cinerariifolium]